MAVCNLFKPLTKDTGTFLVFSQYTEDITRYAVEHDAYTIEPSKFLALNINYDNFNDYYHDIVGTDLNSKIPEMLQKYFENGCAYVKNNLSGSDVWTPDMSANIFWRTLVNCGLLTETADNGFMYYPEIKYKSNIEIQSYTEHGDMGVGELYCYIPNDAKCLKCYYNKVDDQSKNKTNTAKIIEGWTSEELQGIGLVDYEINKSSDSTTYYYGSYIEDTDSSDPTTDSNFNFNTIIVLYNIVSYDENRERTVLYKDIPYGIYFTGKFNGTTLTNTVTKYVTNDDIYGQGTSYGLRICSKFVIQPGNIAKVYNTEVNAENYNAFAQAMAKMAESQAKMDQILAEFNIYQTNIKEHLLNFKNNKANIPYIMESNGVQYWYVNGKQVGRVETGGGRSQQDYSELSNKPRIGNHILNAGQNNPVELGLATSSAVSNIQQTVSSMQTTVTNLGTDVDNLETDVTNLETDVTNLGTNVTNIQNKLNGVTGSITTETWLFYPDDDPTNPIQKTVLITQS